jgi:hypothetical protein
VVSFVPDALLAVRSAGCTQQTTVISATSATTSLALLLDCGAPLLHAAQQIASIIVVLSFLLTRRWRARPTFSYFPKQVGATALTDSTVSGRTAMAAFSVALVVVGSLPAGTS